MLFGMELAKGHGMPYRELKTCNTVLKTDIADEQSPETVWKELF